MSRLPLLFSLLFFVAAGPVLAQTNTGRIVFDATQHDFGVVTEGEQARHTFAFRNEGDVPLIVEDVRPSCGCTTPTWTTEAVKPGATGEIVAVFDSENRPGPFRKSIRVVTDGEPTAAVLYIEGVVEPQMLHGPSQGALVFDRIERPVPTDTSAVVFRVQNAGDRPVRIREVEAPEAFVVEWPQAPLFSGDVVTIRVALAQGASLSEVASDYAVRLMTDDAAQPRKTLRLHSSDVVDTP